MITEITGDVIIDSIEVSENEDQEDEDFEIPDLIDVKNPSSELADLLISTWDEDYEDVWKKQDIKRKKEKSQKSHF